MSAYLVDLLCQKSLIEQYLKEERSFLSSFSFSAIFNWQDFFTFESKMMGGNLCLFAKNETGKFLYLPPLGKDVTYGTIQECFKIMNEANHHPGLSRVENVSEHHLYLFPEEEFAFYPKACEYGYYRKDIAFLKGNKFKAKRSSYNQFCKSYDYQYRPLQAMMLDDCLALYDRWACKRIEKYNDEIYLQMLHENRCVHELALKHMDELGLSGRVVLINGVLAAYTVGLEINKDIFCILFEVTDLTMKGLSVFIFSHFCQDEALQKYKFINVMDDFELENIKKTKLSFHPVVLFPSFVVKRKDV